MAANPDLKLFKVSLVVFQIHSELALILMGENQVTTLSLYHILA